MDVFALRDRLIDEYHQYISGFIAVREPRLRKFVDDYFSQGRLWPEPLVQLNPAFEPGRSVDELVRQDLLHRECANIFRRKESPDTFGSSILLHKHQDDAIRAAASGKSYVLTTGTGSGKSLAYFIPIVDHVVRAGSGKGIKAIVVYPMNALCNSQEDALKRFLQWGYPNNRGPVTFAKYTGQENEEKRQAIRANPPDILLTNFMMLELILTRNEERPLVEASHGLEFLVLDELHTYRGRQGADVSMLVRRVRQHCGDAALRCVGTSATLAGSGSLEARQVEVAKVASRLFGTDVPPVNVINETLRRATIGAEPSPVQLMSVLNGPASYPDEFGSLVRHPLAVWTELALGLDQDEQGRLERRSPRTISDAADHLSHVTGVDKNRCAEHLRALLLAGNRAINPETGFPLFAFRLHQFISRGDTVYSTLESAEHRHLSAEGQVFVPGDRQRRLYPMAFCRYCGQEYHVVSLKNGDQLEPRDLDERSEDDDIAAGFVVMDGPGVLNPLDDISLLPEDWTEQRRGELAVKPNAKKNIPRHIYVTPDGRVTDDPCPNSNIAWFIPAPFRLCFGCGVTYASGRESEFSRLANLSAGGRSTATTILSLSTVQALREDAGLPPDARKMLSFTDNRQDASLQAGHFNDFVQVTLLRAAILGALVNANGAGLTHDEVASRVVEALALDFADYASNPLAQFAARKATDDALREVIGYRAYHDLRRGWRIAAPNLEQVGLLRITYDSLDELCADQQVWQDLCPDLALARPSDRERVCRALLDAMRRALAIKVKYLDPHHQERIRQQSYQHLRAPWALDNGERLREATLLLTGDARRQSREDIAITTRSLLGRFLRRGDNWPATRARGERIPVEEFDGLVSGLMRALTVGGHIEEVPNVAGAYRLQAGVIRWRLGDGTVEHDPIRVTTAPTGKTAVHQFFVKLYQRAASDLRRMEAREHTAQVPSEEREKREERFGKGELPVLYCSPTMELGVDIKGLNAVNLRNVPPTPANYAQRSGRAGRSGQPALVLTYCTSTSPHDQYYFRRPERMVAGAVVPPRLDLANEELIRAHVHAVWLAETGQSLYSSVSELLDLSDPDLPIKAEIQRYIDKPLFQTLAEQRCQQILAAMDDELPPDHAPWYKPGWLSSTIRNAPLALDRAADRWRHLYRTAKLQQERQHQIVADPLRSAEERRIAQRLREEAETQLELLTRSKQDLYSDFYSYRYFATEGFLPGYNFPRLPVTAFIPGRQTGKGEEEYLTRARFIAISEFGPRSIVYHEGNRYRVSRVVLPREDTGGRTRSALFCQQCGYGHFGDRLNVDRCDRCGVLLNAATSRRFDNLLRLESVSTYRVDRISCDEEERLRLGYEMRTVLRFGSRDDGSALTREVEYECNGEAVARATYGPSTTLWRVNLGWNRRKDKNQFGFFLDMERGTWSKSEQEPNTSEDEVDPLAEPTQLERVVPFVEDHRNALIFSLHRCVDKRTLLSLQYALKRGIEAHYQLEDSELACEPLPDNEEPSQILFYEAAEGGAGVLVRLAEETTALADVAREALRICHFDLETGADLRRAEGASEDCEAACYDCLLSYGNQRYHGDLDRQLLPNLLLELSRSVARMGAGGRTREEQRDLLLRLCQSDLEKQFVNWLYEHNLQLPDRAQVTLDEIMARPDFFYEKAAACVYVDGAPHQFPERQKRDADCDTALKRFGCLVIRVQGPESWPAAAQEYPWVFGTPVSEGGKVGQ